MASAKEKAVQGLILKIRELLTVNKKGLPIRGEGGGSLQRKVSLTNLRVEGWRTYSSGSHQGGGRGVQVGGKCDPVLACPNKILSVSSSMTVVLIRLLDARMVE